MANGDGFNRDWCRERHETFEKHCNERYDIINKRFAITAQRTEDMEKELKGVKKLMIGNLITGLAVLASVIGNLLIWIARMN